MRAANYTHVTLVVDPNFGKRANAQASIGPLWVIESPSNRAAIEGLWNSGPSPFENAPTLFNAVSGRTPEDAAMWEISMVDDHHPEWRTFEVVGAGLSQKLIDALIQCAPGTAKETAEGFVFMRADNSN
jgi:hypothetical protein